MNLLKKIFGEKVNHAELVKNGATLIDVRTPAEFNTDKANNSINIPLDSIGENVVKITAMKKPIVVCCKSGMRSSKAASILKQKGITEIYNGGGYTNFL